MTTPAAFIREIERVFGAGLTVRWPDGRVFTNYGGVGQWKRERAKEELDDVIDRR